MLGFHARARGAGSWRWTGTPDCLLALSFQARAGEEQDGDDLQKAGDVHVVGLEDAGGHAVEEHGAG